LYGATPICFLATERRFQPGDSLTAVIRADKLHFFDPDTGQSVVRQPGN
jgi:hypothetical protein